jgi:Na+-driven multidrug efflux pump
MERVWRFALPLVVAQLHKSLLPVAVISFVGQVLPCSFLPLLLQRWWLCCFCFLHSSALYGSYFSSCFVEHTWRFAWPAVIAVMHHTLLPVAVVSFVSQVGYSYH